jgi:crossover junction endodeoxyribonuclease RuvC
MAPSSHIILGIDPGTVAMGYGLAEAKGQQFRLVEMGVLKMNSKQDGYDRLHRIYTKVDELIQQHRPGSFAIEAPFFGKNVQSMLKLGRAQGVAIAAAMRHGLSVTEYSPKKVKQAITGNGNASKEQVMQMLHRLMTIRETANSLDATDALAVAVCHHLQQTSPLAGTAIKKLKGWEDFMAKNPHRIK